MGSTVSSESVGADLARARLYVAWQDPTSRAIEPVGRLERCPGAGEDTYEFRYLRRALKVRGFRPFISFPDLRRVYHSAYLFPFFENRLMARDRADYAEFMRILALDEDADPFEVLARSGGRRQTDTIEVFPDPPYNGHVAECHFLVHGMRHAPGAEGMLGSLAIGDHLFAVLDPQNPVDCRAVLLRDGQWHLLGWVPRYLTELVRRPLECIGPRAVDIRVEHVGTPDIPVHLRLLCRLHAEWRPTWPRPLSGPEFEVVPAQ